MKALAILAVVVLGLAAAAVYSSLGRLSPGAATPVVEKPAVEWSVSNAYTVDNKAVPGMMMIYAESSDGKAEISVRCSRGFWAAYVRTDSHPQFEAGTESATFVSSVDGGAEAVGHATMAGRNMTLGGAALVKRLASARSFRVRYTPFDGDGLVSVDFDLRGLPAAMSVVRDVCGSF